MTPETTENLLWSAISGRFQWPFRHLNDSIKSSRRGSKKRWDNSVNWCFQTSRMHFKSQHFGIAAVGSDLLPLWMLGMFWSSDGLCCNKHSLLKPHVQFDLLSSPQPLRCGVYLQAVWFTLLKKEKKFILTKKAQLIFIFVTFWLISVF